MNDTVVICITIIICVFLFVIAILIEEVMSYKLKMREIEANSKFCNSLEQETRK